MTVGVSWVKRKKSQLRRRCLQTTTTKSKQFSRKNRKKSQRTIFSFFFFYFSLDVKRKMRKIFFSPTQTRKHSEKKKVMLELNTNSSRKEKNDVSKEDNNTRIRSDWVAFWSRCGSKKRRKKLQKLKTYFHARKRLGVCVKCATMALKAAAQLSTLKSRLRHHHGGAVERTNNTSKY
jgi:hypothetical protein